MIFNLGSINIDYFYEVPHLPQPGETLAAKSFATGLGGKGANMSVAIAKAGGQVRHIGAVGPDGAWVKTRLADYGIDVAHISEVDTPTGHAVINVDRQGENAIVIFPGANRKQSPGSIDAALQDARQGDILMFQNETNGKKFAAAQAREKGLQVVYVPAPYDEIAVKDVLSYTQILVLNEIEFSQMMQATGRDVATLGAASIVVTRGAKGALLLEESAGWTERVFAAPAVDPVDTTGAGDTFAGYLAAGLDAGLDAAVALRRAVSAAALQVTRRGTADAIPDLAEVQAFMRQDPTNGASSPHS
ncbi:ribokinase [Roseovarius atlanticus]|uniref:ribokinase n=1 Tax=Roseovarius atlanticus TaxID=1641875 RepID=UPI001C97B147|nr:ribokinase [Roseovarius atlanticus]MBY5987161.1 ribokinase [Roseovarius atlanticus]MBY6125801.1 ribokinase [Roseovarius atlanticus]MBY6149738.1 ribokinase [Roseovarius atlanticus]